jgi:hypothetical protein
VENKKYILFKSLISDVLNWEFFNSKSDVEPYSSIILDPGDVLYVPKGVYHKVVSDGPRASLIFAYHDNLVN